MSDAGTAAADFLRYDVVATEDLARADAAVNLREAEVHDGPIHADGQNGSVKWMSGGTELHDVPEWRNWQTRGTQNPVRLKPSVGSTPTSGTMFSTS